MNDWNIQSRAHGCQACGKAFADQQVYHTLLFDDRSLLVRQDVCEACWSGQFSQGATERKGFVSHWHGHSAAPPAAPPDPIKKETAETLLRKLLERQDPKFAPAVFILAAMLERKRILKVKEQVVHEGQRVFVYEHAASGDILTVGDPHLHLDQLEQVQHDVAALLEHGLPEDPSAAVPPAAPAAPASPTQPEPAPAQPEPAAPGAEPPAAPELPEAAAQGA